jgi:hypothetical protein
MRSSFSAPSELRIDLSCDKLTKPFYTTLDEISGRVIFAPQSPVEVKDVVIDFLGHAKTWIDPPIPGTPRWAAYGQVYCSLGNCLPSSFSK